ncbi:PMS1 protein homolog 1-like [Argopecten irradians]|uniref:PMS1 protein homolog 1-like n=1 Tax=Argopecten irradians TaxID=31199 RepID=UPI003714798F
MTVNNTRVLMANPESRMKELPQSTVRLLGSSQVITSIYSVVKELLENSLDANSSSVDVKLENFGLDRIEVRDNGDGIPTTDIPFVARRYYTSKLSAFSDLEQLTTYGFRGEALGSLCTVADLSVTTKTKEEDVSSTFTFNKEGEIIDTKPSHLGQGTTMLAAHLFKNLPVRRQFYNNVKKKKEELKKVETLVMSFGLIFPKLRITLRHNKDIVWQKNPVQDLRSSVTGTLGKNVFNQMEYKSVKESDPEISVEMYVPSQGSDPQVTSRSSADRCFIYVNSRPVILKDVEKLLKQFYTASHSCEGTRVPVCCVLIVLPSSDIDVNLDPNKTKVLLHHQVSVSNIVKNLLEEVYGSLEPSKTHHKQNSKMDSPKDSDQPSDWRMDLTRKSPENDSIVKITAVENPEKCNGQKIPIFNVTMETNSLTENITITDQVFNKENEFNPLKESLLDDSNVDFSELEIPSVPLHVITPPIESTKNQGKEKQLQEEIIQIQKGCFDIVGDCFKDVLSDDESQCTLKRDDSNSLSKGDNSVIKGDKPDLQPKLLLPETNSDLFDDSLTDALGNLNDKLDGEVSVVSSKQPGDNTREETTSAGELWSKGQMAVNSGSAVLQPVRLLSAGNSKRPLTSPPDLSTPSKKRNIMPEEGQPTLYDMVSGQPVQRGQTGYSVFHRENRSAVVTKNPTASFDEVTDILKDQWENLSQEDQQKYNNTSDSPRGNGFSKKQDRPLGNKMKFKNQTGIDRMFT